ncbi:MAG: tetratricopeptide repeat protein, partial [Cyanobacteria bacterium P01_D01_bin.73]
KPDANSNSNAADKKKPQRPKSGPTTSLSIGQLLDRRYRIVEAQSAGSFGKTYLAADMRRPGYPQCIVRQFQFPSRNPKALQVVQLLFKKKAETLEKLGNHECIPQLLACFEQEAQLYFVEEYITGHPLSQELSPGRKLSDDFVIRLLYDVLTVLTYVHGNGVIHRNIRPTNMVRRDNDGRLVLINFGLIQEISNPSPRAQPEAPKDTDVGVLAYLSPEQRQGNPLYNSDLYAVGMICVQALTGWTAVELRALGRQNSGKKDSGKGVAAEQGNDETQLRGAIGQDLPFGKMPPDVKKSGEISVDDLAAANGNSMGQSSRNGSDGQGKPFQNNGLAGKDRLSAQGMNGVKNTRGDRREGVVSAGLAEFQGVGELPPWRDVATVDPILGDFIDRLIRPHFDLRYQSAEDALNDLKTLYGLMSEASSGIGTSGLGLSSRQGRVASRPGEGKAKQKFAAAWMPKLRRRWPWMRDKRKAAVVAAAVVVGTVGLMIAVRPLQSWYWVGQGNGRLEAGDFKGAVEAYEEAINFSPNNPDALYRRGSVYNDAGDYQSAIADLDRAIRLRPKFAQAYFQRGTARYLLGDLQGAIEDYDLATEYDPKLPAPYLNRGLVKADLGDDKAAIAEYDKAIQRGNNDEVKVLAVAFLNRSLSKSNLEDQKGAIDDATQAIQLNPNYALAYQNRGLAQRRLGDLQAAIEDFNVAIQLAPEDPDPFYNRGLARYELGELQGTVEDFNQAIRLNPSHALVYYDRGVARLRQGDRTGGLSDLRESAKLCLDQGRLGCYRDAQYEIQQLEAGRSDVQPLLSDAEERDIPLSDDEILEEEDPIDGEAVDGSEIQLPASQ